ALARYTSDGSLDPTFNPAGNCGGESTGCPGGVVVTEFHDGDELDAIAALPSGKIVATGDSVGPGRDDTGNFMVLARYMSDGSLDPSFGSGGKVETSWKLGYDGGPFALQGDRIVVAGTRLARFTADGRLDRTFGTHGFAKIGGSAVAAQADGK